ncbi:methyltransferase type 11 [Frondihabitans sp. PAMC 28766]|uniref:class I SAM-dependent methyltransferase n=1 Tax=Frondihabitans sp. PAMC 28766 TaxID=1795630 RepID=UPI00078B7260|nr:class I SAM-dependent methyltransferase [Frondihabitans sp. PAMC 28766]AMM21633.1 methyltransferase type 11 [Frondihabitans sp. PAMC 28766]
MPDAQFSDPRLALLYDPFDGSRADLDHYLDIANELGAKSVLDLGCGTGAFALLLASHGIEVTGVDPAQASLDVAQSKPGAEKVTWLLGDAESLLPLQVDLAVMTGNVAQVFLTDDAWSGTLRGLRAAIAPGGHLVFESRDPEYRAWECWAADPNEQTLDLEGVGRVRHRMEVTNVDLPYVSFRHSYAFDDGYEIPSDSTLRFRTAAEIKDSLEKAGFTLLDIRDAPDRPKAEFVYVSVRNGV